jgi:ketosteroid isomerase-like protein
MPARRPILALLSCAACLTACVSTRAPGFAGARDIEQRCRELEALFRAGDLLGVADLYSDGAELLRPGQEPITGRTGIDEHWSEIAQPLEWTLTTRELGGSGRLAYQVGRSRLTELSEHGPLATESDFLFLWERDAAGRWRIALDVRWPADAR